MATKTKFVKDPDDVLDYEVNWALDPTWVTGDTIVASTFTVDATTVPDGDTTPVAVDSDSFTPTTATAWVSGGTGDPITTYQIVNHITTDSGREMDKVLFFKVTQYAR